MKYYFCFLFCLIFSFGLQVNIQAQCPPDDPNCQEYFGGADIWGDQSQNFLSYGNDQLPDYGVAAGGTWSQEQCGWGEAGPEANGLLEMNEAQGQKYGISDSQDDGTEITISGMGMQNSQIWGTVNNDCDLDISTHNNMSGDSVVFHGENFMSGAQNIGASAGINIDAAQGGGNLAGNQFHSYYQEMENGNWQGGSIRTEHCVSVGGDPVSPCN